MSPPHPAPGRESSEMLWVVGVICLLWAIWNPNVALTALGCALIFTGVMHHPEDSP
jgi:hypothetical protein